MVLGTRPTDPGQSPIGAMTVLSMMGSSRAGLGAPCTMSVEHPSLSASQVLQQRLDVATQGRGRWWYPGPTCPSQPPPFTLAASWSRVAVQL